MLKRLLVRLFVRPKALDAWFRVTFTDTTVTLDVRPPAAAPWTQSFAWADIERICFEAEGSLASDTIYFFTTRRPESYVVPTQASGGTELWDEVLRRGLFDAHLAIEAATSIEGMFCWPKL